MDKTLETPRLTLRPFARSDARRLSVLLTPKIARGLGSFPTPFHLPCAEGFIDIVNARRATGRAHVFAIVHEGEIIGGIGLDAAQKGWSLGYWLGEPYWGAGFATEAAQAVMRAVEQSGEATTLQAHSFTDNPASARVLRRLGFQPTGQTRRAYSLGRMASADAAHFVLDVADLQLAA